MSDFAPAISYVLTREGGLVNDPNDAGGVTNFGITLRFYKTIHPEAVAADIESLTQDQAISFYKIEFWDKTEFNLIENQLIANMAFDMAVNMGIAPAIKTLQRACFSVRAQYELFGDDGILGEKTLGVLNSLDPCCLLSAIRSERAGVYREIVAKEPLQRVFLEGWLRRSYNA